MTRSSSVRGRSLEKRIEKAILKSSKESRERGLQYVFNASEISRIVPTTRKTLAKHSRFVDGILKKIRGSRGPGFGVADLQNLKRRIAYLEDQLSERDLAINGMRKTHIELFRRFYGASIDGEILIRPILTEESRMLGRCLLCDREFDRT